MMSKHFKALITVFFSLVMVMALGVIGLTACGEVDTACSHEFEWTVKKAASCTEEGLETEVCKICHEERNSRPIAKLAHEFQWQEVSASTCTVKGSEKQVCSVCGTEGETREKDLIAHTPAQAPVANTDGTHSYKCSVCGTAVESEPHTATYKQEAGTHQEVCSVCGYEMSTAAAHDFIWRTDKEPTCTETGLRSRVCNTCGYESQIDEEEKKIEKLEHNGGDKWYVDDETGHHYQICTMCKTERLNDGAHEKGDVATASETAGKHHYNCTVCNAEMEETDCTSDEVFHAAENEHYNLCTVCGRQLNNAAHVAGEEWLSDYNGHYNACTSCGAEMNRTAHSYGDEDCTTCHYAKHLTVDTDYTYESVEGGLSIKSYNGTNAHIELPLSHDGQSVLAVSEGAFANNEVITSVVIPEGYFTLGQTAFQNATNLTYLSVPDTVDVIPSYFLQGCSSLSELVLPDELDDLGFDMLDGCDSLTSFVVPKLSSYTHRQTFKGYTGDVSFAEQNIQTIGPMFENYAGKHVTLPASLHEIASTAFYKATNLENIELPKNLYRIGNMAFRYCESLQNLVIPDSLSTMGTSVFTDCTGLEYIIWEGGVSFDAHSSSTFAGCTSLKWVKYGSGHAGMFRDCTELEWIYLPEGVFFEYQAIVKNCTSLKYIFYGGEDIQSYNKNITTSSGPGWTDSNALISCFPVYTYSETYKAPTATETFWHWKDAEETKPEIWEGEGTGTVTVTFHPRGEINTVSASAQQTSVGGTESTEYKMTLILDGSDEATYDILVQVDGMEDKWYGENYNAAHHPLVAFSGTKYSAIGVLKRWSHTNAIFHYNDKKEALNGQAFDITITLDINSRLIGVQIDANYEKEENRLEYTTTMINGGVTIAVVTDYVGENPDVVIPATWTTTVNDEEVTYPVARIAEGAFMENTVIQTIEIPSSVTYIMKNAFNGCTNLTTIYGMDGVTSVDYFAFKDCSALQSIYFPVLDNLNQSGHVFENCSSLKSFVAPLLKSGTTTSMFAGCAQLEYIDIGYLSSVTTSMFDRTVPLKDIVVRNPAISSLEYNTTYAYHSANIWFMGTEAQWSKVTYNKLWKSTLHCSYSPYYHDGGWFFEEENKPALWTAENKATGDALVERDFDLTKNAEEDGYVVTNYKGDSAEVYIPYEYEGLPVTELGENLFDSKAVTTIHLNDCLKKIGAYAFRRVEISGNFALSETLEEIGEYAFEEAKVNSGVDIYVPESVTKLGAYAFTKYAGGVSGFEGLTALPEYAFYDALLSVTFTFPENLIEIGDSAFEGSSLGTVNLPETVTKLGKNVFSHMSRMNSVTGMKGLSELPEGAFEASGSPNPVYANFFDIFLPDNITKIGENALANIKTLWRLSIPASVTEFGANALANFGANNNALAEKGEASAVYFEGEESAWNAIESVAASGLTPVTKVYFFNADWETGKWHWSKDNVPYVWQDSDDPSLRYTTAKVEIIGNGATAVEKGYDGYVFAQGEGSTDGSITVSLSFRDYMTQNKLSTFGWPNIGFKVTYSSETRDPQTVYYTQDYKADDITFSGNRITTKAGSKQWKWVKEKESCKLYFSDDIWPDNVFTCKFTFDDRGMLTAISINM